jgi:AAA domain
MADFARHMEAVARRILGDPNPRHSKKNELRWGTNGSLSVDLIKGTWFSHELQAGGGVLDFIVNEVPGVADSAAAAQWLEDNGFIKPSPRQNSGKNKKADNGADTPHPVIVARYDYEDVDGNPVLRVLRYEPKRFSQAHWEAGAWVKGGIPDEQQVPYHLAELLEGIASGYLVYLCEGEKDADALRAIGMVATTNAGGAGHWLPSLDRWFAGAVKVILVEHNDAAGQLRTQEIGKTLRPVVGALEIMRFDDMGPGGDAAAWLAAEPGRGAEEWNERAEREAVPWEPGEEPAAEAPKSEPEEPIKEASTASFVAPQPIDIASWIGKAPPRRWAVSRLIPRRSVTLISAIGGSGKSYVALQMAVAHALARDWFGHMPEPGPALYVTAEEDEGDIRERLELIAEFYGSTTAEIARAGLVIESLANLDDPFCFVADRNSKVASTPLWDWLAQKVATIKPVSIVLDPITDMAAINENWRREVTQVYGHCRRLAQRADCGLVLTGHVSKGGDYSGNTAWHNSARSRFMLGPPTDDADSDIRYLVHEKNQHGPLAATIALEWKDGLWRMVSGGEAPLRGTARKEAVKRVTFQLIGQATRQGRSISSDPMNGSGQLAVAHEAGGSGLQISKFEFRIAIAELLKEKTIRHYEGEKTSHGDKRRVLRVVAAGDEQPSET